MIESENISYLVFHQKGEERPFFSVKCLSSDSADLYEKNINSEIEIDILTEEEFELFEKEVK